MEEKLFFGLQNLRITTRNTIMNVEELRNKELITWMNKNKNYIMLILHQFKLMTTNGIGILLIPVERIKIDNAQT